MTVDFTAQRDRGPFGGRGDGARTAGSSQALVGTGLVVVHVLKLPSWEKTKGIISRIVAFIED
jgi:hypothetical protein